MLDWKYHTRSILQSLDIKPSKSMGQNFLINRHIVNKMIGILDFQKDDHILEIGGGVGILTEGLININAELTVIEKDARLAKYLVEKYPDATIIHGDALKIDWPDNCTVVANLPYSISTPIIDKIVHNTTKDAIIMIQKEVAERCIAKPGQSNYSRLSFLCQLHAKIKLEFSVPPKSFYPMPKVSSSIIRINLISQKFDNDHKELELLARSLFSLRRRTVRSVIRGFLKRKTKIPKIWDEVPYGGSRVHQLSPQDLDKILTHLKSHEVWPF